MHAIRVQKCVSRMGIDFCMLSEAISYDAVQCGTLDIPLSAVGVKLAISAYGRGKAKKKRTYNRHVTGLTLRRASPMWRVSLDYVGHKRLLSLGDDTCNPSVQARMLCSFVA